jgi:hypothetical protein
MCIAGDIRIERRCGMIVEAIVSRRSLVVREIGGTRAGEVGVHRFLGSPLVRPEGLLAEFAERTAKAAQGREIVAVQDTSEINFAGRGASRRGLGPAGDGESPGFFVHPVVAVDATSEAVLGLAGARIWTRAQGRVSERRNRGFAEKESMRWLAGARCAAEVLQRAARVTVVSDQESDIYELFANRPDNAELLVRARHDRQLADGGLMSQAVPAARVCMSVAVAPKRPGEKPRIAHLEVAFAPVRLKRPARAAGDAPESLDLFLVSASEPEGVLQWRLLTSRPIACPLDALEAIRLYRLRWRGEEVFRLLKRDGLALEDSQIETAPRLFNLAALGLEAAVRIIQLVDARDGSERPATDVVDAAAIAPASAIAATLEGKTARQKNTHPPGSLAWLAWIVARLGGWNCYYKPPGPKTMARGWRRFEAMVQGYLIAEGKADV